MISPGRQHDGLIGRLLESAADRSGDTALFCDGVELDYESLAARTLAARRLLEARGVGAGDRVLLSLTKSIDQVTLILGTWALGGVAVPVHPVYSNEQLETIALDCQPRLIFVGRLRYASLETERFGAPIEVVPEAGSELTLPDAGENAGANPASTDPAHFDPSALAVLFYGASSAGRMTGVGWSHDHLIDASRALLERWDAAPNDRIGGLLCLNVPIGLLQLVQSLVGGLPLLLHSSVFPKDLFRFIADRQLTHLTLMPITIARMFHPRLYVPGGGAPERVRSIVVSGRRPGEDALARLQREFPRAKIQTVYGDREGLPLAWWSDSLGAWEPIPAVELSVRRDPAAEDSAGEYGELRVRGETAMGPWNPEGLEVDQTVVFSIGDLARGDAERGFDIRPADDRIETQGYAVFPEEVERVIRPLPGLERAVAFGVPHEERANAVVVAWPEGPLEIERQALHSRAMEQLPGYMRPLEWIELPAELFSLESEPIDSMALASLRRRLRAEYLSRLGS